MPTKTRGARFDPIIITGIIVIGVLLVLVLMVIAGENTTNKLKAQTGFSLACPAKTINLPWTTTTGNSSRQLTAGMAKSRAIAQAYTLLRNEYNSLRGRDACKGTIDPTPALNCAPPVGCGEMGQPRGSKKDVNQQADCIASPPVRERNYAGNYTGLWSGAATCTGFCEWRQGCKELFSSPAPR